MDKMLTAQVLNTPCFNTSHLFSILLTTKVNTSRTIPLIGINMSEGKINYQPKLLPTSHAKPDVLGIFIRVKH